MERTMNTTTGKDCPAIFNSLCWLVDCAQTACTTAEQAALPETLQKDLEDIQRAIKKAKSTILENAL
ncbi:MAG: hypothetical protein EBY32_13040 [Proteobacteria bacterium]|nr:hypothetical protein [Pseudomonadota bacterium]